VGVGDGPAVGWPVGVDRTVLVGDGVRVGLGVDVGVRVDVQVGVHDGNTGVVGTMAALLRIMGR
jgi:hypothetical protein